MDAAHGRPMSRRSYMGGSSIGEECPREAYMKWRWIYPRLQDAKLFRVFDLGNSIEDDVADFLRTFKQYTLKTKDGPDQIGGTYFGGHLGWHIDGLLDTQFSRHLWECKSANSRRFNALAKTGILSAIYGADTDLGYSLWSPTYGAQVQFYMGALKESGIDCDSALVTVYNKNTSDLYIEEVTPDPDAFEELQEQARWLLSLPAPPDAAFSSGSYQVRNYMRRDQRGIYLGEYTPSDPNCRNCRHSKPRLDDPEMRGQWGCTKFKKLLSQRDQEAGCFSHQWMPDLINATLIDEDNAIYEKDDTRFRNAPADEVGKGELMSSEIAFLSRNEWNFDATNVLAEIRQETNGTFQTEINKDDSDREEDPVA